MRPASRPRNLRGDRARATWHRSRRRGASIVAFVRYRRGSWFASAIHADTTNFPGRQHMEEELRLGGGRQLASLPERSLRLRPLFFQTPREPALLRRRDVASRPRVPAPDADDVRASVVPPPRHASSGNHLRTARDRWAVRRGSRPARRRRRRGDTNRGPLSRIRYVPVVRAAANSEHCDTRRRG